MSSTNYPAAKPPRDRGPARLRSITPAVSALPTRSTATFIQWPEKGELRVRRLVSRSAPRPITKYPSVRLGRSVHCESEVEVELAELLDACPQVPRFGEQPAVIHYLQEGQRHRHIPDFLACTPQRKAFLEAKFEKDLTPEVIARTLLMKQILEPLGYAYHVISERHTRSGYLLDNARFIARRARTVPDPAHRLQLVTRVRTAESIAFGDFATDVECALVCRLLMEGLLCIPMNELLGPATPVVEAREGQPWVWALFK